MSGGRVSRWAGGKLLALSVTVLGVALASFASADRAGAADRRGSSSGVFVSEMSDVQRVKVIVNKSRTFRVDTAFSTIVAGAPDIAEVRSLSDHVIYIQGKQTGTTNVILFDSTMKQIGILDVEVAIDTGNLQQNIHSSTGAHGIRVSSTEGQVVLSGTAADAVAAERAMAIATGSVPKGGVVVNAMSVAAPQQVMLEVRFLEVDRTAGRQLGVNLQGGNGNGTQLVNTGLGADGPNGAITQVQGGAQGNGIPLIGTASTLVAGAIPFGNLLTNVLKLNNGTSVDVLITALETKGLVRRLAEPNLIALSGDFGAIPRRRRISGAGGLEPRRGSAPHGHHRIQEVWRRAWVRSDRAVPRCHQFAGRAFGQRTRLHQCHNHRRHDDSGPDPSRRANDRRIARRPELCDRRFAAEPQPGGYFATALDRFGAGAGDPVPQFVL